MLIQVCVDWAPTILRFRVQNLTKKRLVIQIQGKVFEEKQKRVLAHSGGAHKTVGDMDLVLANGNGLRSCIISQNMLKTSVRSRAHKHKHTKCALTLTHTHPVGVVSNKLSHSPPHYLPAAAGD